MPGPGFGGPGGPGPGGGGFGGGPRGGFGGPGFGGPGFGGPGFGGPGMGPGFGGPGFGGPGMGPGWMGRRPGPLFRAHEYGGNIGSGGIFDEFDETKARLDVADQYSKNPVKQAGFVLFGGAMAGLMSIRDVAKETKLVNDHKAGLISDEEYEHRMERLRNPQPKENKGKTKTAKEARKTNPSNADETSYMYHKRREALFKKKLEEVNKRYMNYEITEEEARQIMAEYEAELNDPSKGLSK